MTERIDGAPGEDDAKPFLEHLEELRGTLIRTALALFVGMIIAGVFAPQMVRVLTQPLIDIGYDPATFLRSLRVAGAMSVILRVAAWGGLLLSLPAMLWYVGAFVFPGLTEKERKIIFKAGAFSVVLFAFGVCLGYFYCLPIALKFMLMAHDWISVAPEWTINDYVAFSMQLLIGFGLAFQLPIIILVLGKLGIVKVATLQKHRPHAVVACLVIGMLLTPQDIMSMMILAAPLYILFEMCVVILWFDDRKARREA